MSLLRRANRREFLFLPELRKEIKNKAGRNKRYQANRSLFIELLPSPSRPVAGVQVFEAEGRQIKNYRLDCRYPDYCFADFSRLASSGIKQLFKPVYKQPTKSLLTRIPCCLEPKRHINAWAALTIDFLKII